MTDATRTLLEAAKRAPLVPPDRKARGRAQLLSAMAAGTVTATALAAEASVALGSSATAAASAGATVAGTTAVAGASSSLLGLGASAVAAGLLAGSVVVTVASELWEPAPSPSLSVKASEQALARPKFPGVRLAPPAEHAAPRVTEEVPSDLAEPNAVVAGENSKPPIAPGAVPQSRTFAAPKPNASSIEEETRLLQSAQGALRRGLYGEALQSLTEHEQTYPRSALMEEAIALRVLVHCGAGRVVEARRWAQGFVSHFPKSAHLGRLMSSCPEAFLREGL